jgi:hypothetical protein
MDMLEELKERDERIERLEKTLLLLLSSIIGNRGGNSAETHLMCFQTFPLEKVEMLLEEYGSTEKVIERFTAMLEEKRHSQSHQ